jgi:signal transduction histidine kinase
MGTRTLRALRQGLDPIVGDWALAAIFIAIAQWEIWVTGLVGGSKAINTLSLLLATVALAWRRRRPLPSSFAVTAGVAAQAALTGEAPIGLVVAGPIFVSVYSVAAHGERWDALVGLGLTAAAGTIHDLNAPEIRPQDVDDQWFWWLAVVAAWIIGLYVRRHRQARALEDLTARLEGEREEQARLGAARERARVARELHDIVSHGVGLIALQAGAGQEAVDEEPARARAAGGDRGYRSRGRERAAPPAGCAAPRRRRPGTRASARPGRARAAGRAAAQGGRGGRAGGPRPARAAARGD